MVVIKPNRELARCRNLKTVRDESASREVKLPQFRVVRAARRESKQAAIECRWQTKISRIVPLKLVWLALALTQRPDIESFFPRPDPPIRAAGSHLQNTMRSRGIAQEADRFGAQERNLRAGSALFQDRVEFFGNSP